MSKAKKLLKVVLSYNSLHELTKAIQLVALSRLRIIKEGAGKEAIALSSIKKLFDCSAKIDSIAQTYLVVPITSDKSCCGPINTNILDQLMTQTILLREQNKEFSIFLIGRKGRTYVSRFFENNYIKNVANINKEETTLLTSSIIAEKISSCKFDKCIFLFNHLYSVFDQSPSVYHMLSYDHFISNIYVKLNGGSDVLFWSALIEKVDSNALFLRDLYDFSFAVVLLSALRENELSELGGRVTAMQSASSNAAKIRDKMRLTYNKARQSYITNELIEIVSCITSLGVNK